MKNRKGFTMVELLATLVILGILMALGIPTILHVIDRGRSKIYISDAKKMISLAEYRLKKNDYVIEKPKNGNYIAISLNFLDDDTFDKSPNNGKYLFYSSFVLVRNNGGDLEYYVTLIEKKNEGYKGVTLVKEDSLLKKDAIKYVKSFPKDSIVSLEGVDGYNELDADYIRENLSDLYPEGSSDPYIEAFYNFENSSS